MLVHGRFLAVFLLALLIYSFNDAHAKKKWEGETRIKRSEQHTNPEALTLNEPHVYYTRTDDIFRVHGHAKVTADSKNLIKIAADYEKYDEKVGTNKKLADYIVESTVIDRSKYFTYIWSHMELDYRGLLMVRAKTYLKTQILKLQDQAYATRWINVPKKENDKKWNKPSVERFSRLEGSWYNVEKPMSVCFPDSNKARAEDNKGTPCSYLHYFIMLKADKLPLGVPVSEAEWIIKNRMTPGVVELIKNIVYRANLIK